MGKNLNGKIVAIVAVLLVFLYGIFGIPQGGLKASLERHIKLGLDLQGGAHLVLKVRVAEAVGAETDSDMARLQGDLEKASVTGAQVVKLDPAGHPDVIAVNNVPINSTSQAREVLDGVSYSNVYNVASQGNGYVLTMKPEYRRSLEQKTVDTSVETIYDRVNALGVSEPLVQPFGLGQNEILVELPGVSDTNEIHNAIQTTARLEIHEVVSTAPSANEQDAIAAAGGTLSPDEIVMRGASSVTSTSSTDEYYVLKRVAVIAGSDFRDAQPTPNPNTGASQTSFNLTTSGGDKFYAFTSANVGKSLAVVLGGRVRSVANIKDPIRDSGVIEGLSEQEASSLSKLLRTGSLPAGIDYLETRSVGPSLGAASIRQGVMASIVGMAAVMIFMLVYYKGAGINADLALLLNLVILLGFMGYFHGVLTLPGIAGVILTIGMGVDSNVLIFERIREELRAGKSAAAAVKQGFDNALRTIIDTHVTTVVSALILFMFGTGPVKGFALTLTFGLMANLFTAVFVSRVIFDSILSKKERGAALSI